MFREFKSISIEMLFFYAILVYLSLFVNNMFVELNIIMIYKTNKSTAFQIRKADGPVQ
jgi:hypothetical protein